MSRLSDIVTESKSIWEYIQHSQKPIVLYGMGLGAEKLIDALMLIGKTPSAIFASDGFVRGNQFHGFRVQSFEEIRKSFSDFIILVAFASSRPEMIHYIRSLAMEYELYVPYLPVIGDGLVNRSWINEHETEICACFDLLADSQSRQVFSAVLNFQLSGKPLPFFKTFTDKSGGYQLLNITCNEDYLDLGAYDGDTIRDVMAAAGGELKRVVAVEPDPKNFKKLKAFRASLQRTITILNAGVSSQDCILPFACKAGRHSALDPSGTPVAMRSIDSIAAEIPFTLIKMDVEGEEAAVIAGGRKLIAQYAPKLIVSAYHRTGDLFTLVNQIHVINPSYRIFLRQHPYFPAWDTLIYTIL